MLDYTPLARGSYLEALHAEEDGTVWFSDVMVGGIRRLSPEGGSAGGKLDVWLPERSMIGSVILNADGKALVAGGGGIVWLDPTSGDSGSLVDALVGEPLGGANEMCGDGAGGLIFGTLDLPAVLEGRKPAPAAIVHLPRGGAARAIATGLSFCNGLALVGERLFHNESFTASYAYDVGADGLLVNKTRIAAASDCDGMAVDAQGWLWISYYASNHLLRLDPVSGASETVPLPAGTACTSVRFGGPGLSELYINTVPLDAAERLVALQPLDPQGSVLYKAAAPVPGRREVAPAFTLG